MALELTEEFTRALELLETTDKNIFLTGKAGTGKSTLLEEFRRTTKKNIAVLAPTGVAAVNVRGQTIHSFFGFKPNISPEHVQKVSARYGKNPTLYKELDTIVIDEISMVRADLLDCIDKFLRLNGPDKYAPFGGIQMVFIGDLYQLPPVVTNEDRLTLGERYASPYFFDADVFNCFTMTVIELERVFRQRDEDFLAILNSIRTNSASYDHLATLNQLYNPDFSPLGNDYYIYLTTTNQIADMVNDQRLGELTTPLISYEGSLHGEFVAKDTPAPQLLQIKEEAQVMLLNNDTAKRWVNGTIGKITKIEAKTGEPDSIHVQLADNQTVEVLPHTWESYRFDVDENTKQVDARSIGSYTQYPMKLAWAVTIHKSQGKTFDKVVIDIGRGTFAHGQMYVALSRCRTLEGIVLKQMIHKRNIIMDQRVNAFMQQFSESSFYRGAEAIDQPQSLF